MVPCSILRASLRLLAFILRSPFLSLLFNLASSFICCEKEAHLFSVAMAALTVSAWVASPLIKTLVDKVRSYIEGQFNWHKDIKKNLEKLEDVLKGIQTVVEEAEQQPSLNASQKELLCSIKSAIYEADDVVDEFEYRILEAQAMKATGTVSGTAFSSRKFVKRLIGQDKLPKKLKNILDKLDNIRKSANIFNVQVAASTMISANEPGGNTHDYDCDSSSDLTSELSGRVTEKNMLIDLLLQKVLKGRLRITNLKNVGCQQEAVEADLQLDWGSRQRTIIGHDGYEEVADAVRPHPNLKELTIRGFRGTRMPSWLQTKWLVNLEYLALIDCFHLRVLPSLEHLPLLRRLYVSKCPNLKQFSIFPCTIRDIFVGAPRLISVESSHEDDFKLRISDIPASLRDLQQDQWLQAIKELWIRDYAGGGGILTCAALKNVTIRCCPELLTSEEEVVVQSLIIDDCPGTYSWPSRCLQGLTSLKHLEIRFHNWPKLESLSEADGSGVLPSSLESLEIWKCRHTKRWLSRCPQGLTSLRRLKVSFCFEEEEEEEEDGGVVLLSSLESLEIYDWHVTDLSLISHCPSLKHLEVNYCPELKSLPEEGLPASLEKVCFLKSRVPKESLERCLQGLASLSDLTVDFWPHLTSLPSLRRLTVEYCRSEGTSEVELPQCLESLEISECDVSDTLLSTCLQGLTSLSQLKIHSCTGLMSLPSAQVLQHLTALQELTIHFSEELTSLGGLHTHASLKRLKVSQCPNLKSLPEEGMPPSIEYLNLRGCHPALEQQIHEKKGPDWEKVADISDIDID